MKRCLTPPPPPPIESLAVCMLNDLTSWNRNIPLRLLKHTVARVFFSRICLFCTNCCRLVTESSVFLSSVGNEWLLEGQTVMGDIADLSQPLSVTCSVPAQLLSTDPALTISAWVYYCLSEGGACMMKAVAFKQPLLIDSEPTSGTVTVTLAHAF